MNLSLKIDTHIAQENRRSNCHHSNERKTQKRYRASRRRKEVGAYWGRRGREAVRRGLCPECRSGASLRSPESSAIPAGALDLTRGSDRRRGVGAGAGVGGVRRLPSTLPFQPASHRCLRSRVGRCRAGLDWTGLPSPPLPTLPPLFPSSAPRLPFCSLPGPFPFGISAPAASPQLAPSQSA
jgi:hypothetical protein